MKRKLMYVGAALAVVGMVYLSWAALRAHRNLVTLDVRNMDVREVVKKIQWQTWEDIFVAKEVQGKVTLKVTKQPLERVLGMVAGQASARSATLYPLYSSGKSFTNLKKSLRGEVDPATHGWTNLPSRAMGRGPGLTFGPGPTPTQPQNQFVSLNLYAKDLSFAMLAMNRFAQARVVPEDGTAQRAVSLMIKNASVPAAVSQLAKKVNLKWKPVYALQAGFRGPPPGDRGPGGEMQLANSGSNGQRMFFRESSSSTNSVRREERQALEAELLAALPADQQQKAEQAQQEREQQRQEMQGLTPEQRRGQMPQMSATAMSQMNRDRILNSTPEQRAQRRSGGGPRMR